MRLKTHTAYPDTHIDPVSFAWRSALLSPAGKVLDHTQGEADSRDEARDAAVVWWGPKADDYLKPVAQSTVAIDPKTFAWNVLLQDEEGEELGRFDGTGDDLHAATQAVNRLHGKLGATHRIVLATDGEG